MNWILDTYSNVYTTAMMRELKSPQNVADAKKPSLGTRIVHGLFARG